MPRGVYKRTEEYRKKLSLSKMGDKNPAKRFDVREKIRKANTGKKHTEEQNKKISLGNKGKIVLEETKEKLRIKNLGRKMSEEDKRKMSLAKIGKKHSEERRKRQSDRMIGNKSHFWKGGLTSLFLKIRHSFKSRQWRSDVFTRDDFTCQECGLRGVYLEAHHIKRFSKIIEEYQIKTLEQALNCEELWNINNGKTLCGGCHNKTKTYEK
jgi:hypothetical protein